MSMLRLKILRLLDLTYKCFTVYRNSFPTYTSLSNFILALVGKHYLYR